MKDVKRGGPAAATDGPPRFTSSSQLASDRITLPLEVPMKQLLYVTQSCGYRHAVLPFSQEMMKQIGEKSSAFQATCTDDVSTVDWGNLGRYDAIAFCTTGELPLDDAAKTA